ncbi:arginine/serine-rich protein 1 isoform X2 [Centropristis striata]|uniref:arginine/serine-rich protein 1 isoform X2 n=1 Tax=Centropristis striata TaxID=184440 RepID=UPI0027DFC269|nr:arginine/serine-rich protein 1 isoform X2 [Centropristis striata]
MTKGEDSHSEMANVCQSDGINVIFDQSSPSSSHSRSRSRSGSCSRSSLGSNRYRGRDSHRRGYKSKKSSSSSSRSSSTGRSRSHPRCHRPSSRCRCDNHRRYGRSRRSPPRRYRAQSRSYSRSPSPDRSSHSRRPRKYRRTVRRLSRSPSRTRRGGSRSGSSGHSGNLSLDNKSQLLKAAVANATTVLGVEKLELPESVKPILSEPSETKRVSPETWVRQDPEKTPSQAEFFFLHLGQHVNTR